MCWVGLLGTSCPESCEGACLVPTQICPKISECGPPLQQGQHAPHSSCRTWGGSAPPLTWLPQSLFRETISPSRCVGGRDRKPFLIGTSTSAAPGRCKQRAWGVWSAFTKVNLFVFVELRDARCMLKDRKPSHLSLNRRPRKHRLRPESPLRALSPPMGSFPLQ